MESAVGTGRIVTRDGFKVVISSLLKRSLYVKRSFKSAV